MADKAFTARVLLVGLALAAGLAGFGFGSWSTEPDASAGLQPARALSSKTRSSTPLAIAAIRKSGPAVASPGLVAELDSVVELLTANVTDDPHSYVGLGEVRRITNAQSGFHMSGYFDKSPWNFDGSLMLVQQVPFYHKYMSAADVLKIGVLHLDDPTGPRIEFLVNTTAWNFQQGTMLQWLGNSNHMVYNARPEANTFVGVIYDVVHRKQLATLPMPVYSLNYNGTVAVSLNFARLYAGRRDYGYVVDEPTAAAIRAKPCPDDDGIWVMQGIQDPANVEPRLLISIQTVFNAIVSSQANDTVTQKPYASTLPKVDVRVLQSECISWINHAQVNREGTKVLFLYRFGHCKHVQGWATFPFTVDVATGELWRLPLAHGSHHDFGWDDNLISCDGSGYYYAKPKSFAVSLARPAEVAQGGDGHCSFAPTSNEFILSDTYPKKSADFPTPTRALFTWDLVRNRTTIIGHYAPVKEGTDGAVRVDLHPRWSRDGRYVSWDSTHEGVGRQVYVAKPYAKALMRPGVDSLTRAPRKYFMDLGARSGDTIEKFLKTKTDGADYIFVGFECNPENMAIVRTNMEKLAVQYKLKKEQSVLVEAAAWIEKGTLTFNMDTRPVGVDGKPGKTGGSLFTSPHAQGTKVTVPTLDFGQYLESNVEYIDHVVCKIDIEGAEYELLAHMIRQGTIILCDVVYIEWHSRFRKDWVGWDARYEAMLSRMGIPVVIIG